MAAGNGAGYVTDDLRDLVVSFDPAGGRVEGVVQLSGRPVAMVRDGRDLWVADMVDNHVVEVDAGTLASCGPCRCRRGLPAWPCSAATCGSPR